MRRLTTTERSVAGVSAVLLVANLFGCTQGEGGGADPSASTSASASARAERTASAQPTRRVLTAVGAVVINGKDHTGRAVGVRSYAGPWDGTAKGIYPEGEQLEVLCAVPGRTVTDTDVPEGQKPVTSGRWYLLNTSLQDWMGNGYVRPGGAVPPCPADVIPPRPVPAEVAPLPLAPAPVQG